MLFCFGRVFFLTLEWTLTTFELPTLFFVLLDFFVRELLFASFFRVGAVQDDLAEQVVNMPVFPLELICLLAKGARVFFLFKAVVPALKTDQCFTLFALHRLGQNAEADSAL